MKYAMDIHKLYEPLEYNINSGGKDILRLTILYIQTLLHNKNNPLTDIIIDDINIAHNTSLIIDDIHDSSIKRRGQLCAYLLFGKPLTLNAGYLKCLSLLNNIDKKYPKLIADYVKDLYIDSFYKGHIGQGLDIYWATNKYTPTISEYLLMIDNKTGIIFNTIAKLCVSSLKLVDKTTEKKNDLLLLMLYIGRFFQIRDDYINLTCPEYWKLKGFCEDLDHNNVSYVLCLYKQIINKPLNTKTKLKTYRILYKSNIFTMAYYILNTYKDKIIAIEKRITGEPIISSYLTEFFSKLYITKALSPKRILKYID